MPRADICKSFVRAEPHFHTKFCIKRHEHHKKILCSFGGTAGGGGGASLYEPGINHGNFANFPQNGFTVATGFVPETATLVGHEHMHHIPPTNSVPGPIVGSGIVGWVLAATLVALARRRRRV